MWAAILRSSIKLISACMNHQGAALRACGGEFTGSSVIDE